MILPKKDRSKSGSDPVEALIFFRLLPSNCLNWKFTAMITLHFLVVVVLLLLLPQTRALKGDDDTDDKDS